MNKNRTLSLFAIFFAAFFFRVLYLLFLKKYYFFYDYPGSDVLYYQNWASDIASGNWLGNGVFFGLPLYAYFLAVLKRLFLNNLEIIRLLHLTLGSLNCVLVYLTAEKILSRKTAYVSSLLAAVNFILIYYDTFLLPTTLIISLSLVTVLAILNMNEETKKKEWLFLGILLGMGLLADGKFLFVFALLTFYLFRRFQGTPDFKTRIFMPLLLGFLGIALAVTIRNGIIGKDCVFISAQSGLSFYSGNHSDSTGIFENLSFIHPDHEGQDRDQRILAEHALKKPLKPSEVSRYWFRQGLDFIFRSPAQYGKLLGRKFLNFFRDNEAAYDIDLLLQKKWKDAWDLNSFRLIVPFFLIGFWIALRERKNTALLDIFVISQLIFSLVFFVTLKHRSTILPFLIIFEAYGLIWIFETLKQRSYRILGVLILVAVMFFLLKPKEMEARETDFLEFSKRGLISAEKNDFTGAEKFYRKALSLKPQDTNALYNLAVLYLTQNRIDQAVGILTGILQLNPFDVDATYNLAYGHEALGRTDTALYLYQRVIGFWPESIDAHYRLAQLYKKTGDCASARQHYTAIVSIQPARKKEISSLISQCPN